MKKNELFKIIGIAFLAVFLLTWFIPIGGYSTGSFVLGKTDPQGIVDLARTPLIAIVNLMQYAVYFIALGAFYGVLNKTGVYSRIVDGIAKKVKNKKLFLIITTILFALLSSLVGITWGLFVIIPFIAAIMIKMGYKNITALLSTIGAILVGTIGATYGYETVGSLVSMFSIKMSDMVIAKAIIFVVVIGLYLLFILKNASTKKQSKKGSKKEEKNIEDSIMISLYEENDNKKKSTLALAIIGIVSFTLILVAMFSWQEVLSVDFFYNTYEKLMELTVNDYPLVSNIIGNITPFGYWGIYDLIIFLILLTFLIGWVYGLKLDDIIDGMANGVKKVLPTAFYVTIASVVFAIMFSTSSGDNIFYTIYHFVLSWTKNFSVLTAALGTLFGGLFYNDFASLVSAVSTPLLAYNKTDLVPLMGLITQSIYGLVMFVAPTSILLVSGLSLFNVSYKEWIKTLWKFLCITLGFLVLMFVVISMIMA